jgi:hypothetical protein
MDDDENTLSEFEVDAEVADATESQSRFQFAPITFDKPVETNKTVIDEEKEKHKKRHVTHASHRSDCVLLTSHDSLQSGSIRR